MPTYTTKFQATNAVAGLTGTAANRDAAVVAAIAAAPGPVGKEVAVLSCDLVGMTGPTGIYGTTYQVSNPVTGSTFNATSYEDAVRQQVAAGPTGPGAGIEIWSAST